MRHWCLKEAYVKELGVGITIDLQKISFSVDQQKDLSENADFPLTNTTLCCNGNKMAKWHFEEHLLNGDYCAAIAFRNCLPEPAKFQFLTLQDIIMENEANLGNFELIEYCKQVLRKQRKSR